VQSGDTLSGIARTFGVSVSAIQDANNLRSTIIQIGQRLLVPGTVTTRPDPLTKPPIVPGQVTHTVKVGETLTEIASTYGMTPQLLADMNSIEDPRDLQAGQVLIVNPAPITEEPNPTAGESGDDPDDLEAIFKNAGEAPVIPLPPKNE
jgi:LysM repeat protein